jgi:tetratricopeptide (TPR) repeat protein
MSIATRIDFLSPHYNVRVIRQISTAVLVAAAVAATAPFVRAQEVTVLANTFENQTGERGLDWLGEGLAFLIAEKLGAQRQLYVFGFDERAAAYDRLGIPENVPISRATAIRIGWDMGADVLVSGRFSGTHQEFRIEARVLDLDASRSRADVAVTGRLDDVIPLAASLASKLAQQLVPGAQVPESDYVAQPPIPRSAFEAYIRGMLATEQQRHFDLLQEAIRLHPQYTAAMYQLGQSYYLDANYKASSGLLERVSAVSPEYPLARFMLGMDYYRLGDAAKAIAVFSTLPPSYDVLINLGAAHALEGNAAAAYTVWRRAASVPTDTQEALFNLAYLAFNQGDVDTAADGLNEFLRNHNRDAEAQFLLGRVYERIGRTEDAQRLFTQSTRLSPRLERWVGAPLPNLTRLRTQFDATELRLPAGVSLWTEARLSRKPPLP